MKLLIFNLNGQAIHNISDKRKEKKCFIKTFIIALKTKCRNKNIQKIHNKYYTDFKN